MLQKHGEEDPEESWREDTTLFDPAAMLKGSEVLPLNCTVPCMLLWKDSIKGHTGRLLFPALLLKLAKGEDHVYR